MFSNKVFFNVNHYKLKSFLKSGENYLIMIDCAMNKKYINQIGTCKQSYKALTCCATIHTAYRTALERVFVLFVFGGGGGDGGGVSMRLRLYRLTFCSFSFFSDLTS